MPPPRVSIGRNHDLRRYILPTETVVVATRRHWASLLEPAATAVGVFLAVAVVVFVAPPELQDAAGWLWFVWLFFLGRFGFRWLEWAHQWFVSTDKRLLLLYGLVIHKVAMMPLLKVTDMGYSRTPMGQLLGYGRFVMESAGQDQALRQIDFVPHPDATYRTLCAEIFRPTAAKHDTSVRPLAPGGSVPAGSAAPPVVIVPGRSGQEDPRPTTQPIPVAGRSATDSAALRPPRVAPAPGMAPAWAGTPDPASSPGSPTAGAPEWHTPPEWKRPEPYDPHTH